MNKLINFSFQANDYTMTDHGKFLRKFNQAISNNDLEFIQKSITDDITWVIAGQKIVEGKENFMSELRAMNGEEGFELRIDNIITQGTHASVNGTIRTKHKSSQSMIYAFCDIYSLGGFKSIKIKKITSYLIQAPPH